MKLLGHVVILFLIFRRAAMLFSNKFYHFIFAPTVYKASSFSIFSPTLVLGIDTGFGDSSRPDGCEVISHCDFDLHFPHVSEVEYLFICL